MNTSIALRSVGILLIVLGLLLCFGNVLIPYIWNFSAIEGGHTEIGNPNETLQISQAIGLVLITLIPVGILLFIADTIQRFFPSSTGRAKSNNTLLSISTLAKAVLIFIGTASILLALLGLWLSLTSLYSSWFNLSTTGESKYFVPVYYVMSMVCILFHIALLICGVQFLRLRTTLLKYFVGVIILECIYFFIVSVFWLIPASEISIVETILNANVGMSYQISSYFFLWAPILAWLAARKTSHKIEPIELAD